MGGRGAYSESMKSASISASGAVGHELFADDKSDKAIAEALGISEKEVIPLRMAILDFTNTEFSTIRAAQNNASELSEAERKFGNKQGEKLEKYISLAPKWDGGTTYRGINISEEDLNKYKVGQTIDVNRGTASWTSNLETGKEFSKGTYKDGAGQRVVFVSSSQKNGTSIKHLSNYKKEDEVLVSKNSNYKITSINKKKDGIIYIRVKEK